MTRLALAALLAAASFAVAADARQEVNALLERLASSECRFHRNGEWHGAQRARRHLETKLANQERWGKLESAEQFIEKVASGSSTTGEPYLVECGTAAAVTSAEWLTGQLKALRAR